MKTKVMQCPHCGETEQNQGVTAPHFSLTHGGVEWAVACLNPACHKEYVVHFSQYKITKTSKQFPMTEPKMVF